jgi:Ca-activated chloride channel family protein
MTLHFGQPLWLLAGLLACLAAILFIRSNIVRRKKALQEFASPHLLQALTRNVSPARRRTKNILLVLAVACLFVALARPQYGNRWVEVKQKGIDILIGFDVSKSMLARDISPDRLTRAKLAVRDFVARLEGDRVGLMPFAGTAFLMCPLTTDYEAFNTSLDALDVNIIPKGGTNIGAAIREAEKVLNNEANHKILILVTDGEDLSADAIAAARQAKEEKMTIYTIGVGTPEGELIPSTDRSRGQFIQDDSGKFVTSRLDEKTLSEIARITGGLYVPLGSMGQGFDVVYEQKLALVPREEHGERKRKLPVERFAWPLGAAVILLGADFLITGRKGQWALRLPFVRTAGRRRARQAAAMFLLAVLLVWQQPAQASRGEELFQAGKLEQARDYYEQALKKNPQDPVLHFNLGDVAYKEKKYEEAVSAYNEALKTDDLKLQARSYYNRGNARFYMGRATEKTDPDHTMEQWQEAVRSFEAAAKLNPDDEQVRHNLEIVKKRLEQLKKQQQQKKKQQQDQNKKDNKENQKNKDSQNNKDQKGQQDKKNSDSNKEGQQGSKAKNNEQHKQDRQNKNNQGQQSREEKKKNEQKENKQGQGEQNKEKKEEKQPQGGKQTDKKQQAGQEDRNNSPGNPADRQQSARKNGENPAEAMHRQDLERKKQGKMTREEAKNLLNSLKGEQKELNFIPQGSGSNTDNGNRDW